MVHKNYFEIYGKNHYEFGLSLGEEFRTQAVEDIEQCGQWIKSLERNEALKSMKITYENFPEYYEEIKGYAKGANVRFDDLWSLMAYESDKSVEKCTTVVTGPNVLVGHNEDWDEYSCDSVCILKKTIGKETIFELFYYNTLGGNSISINSSGYIHAVNSLFHKDSNSGIPANVIARWLSSIKVPDDDFSKLHQLNRQDGYSHTIVHESGDLWNIETTANEQFISRPNFPFAHTNHYLSDLRRFEARKSFNKSKVRLKAALSGLNQRMSSKSLKKLLDQGDGYGTGCLFNKYTIARTVIDLANREIWVWLKRESEKKWIKYSLDFIFKED